MATRMQQRRGTASQWTSADPILEAGEFGFESDTGKFKIGDGVNQWSDLEYFINEAAIAVDVSGAIADSEKGAANGVATLDSTGKIPVGQLGNLIDGAPNALNTLNEIAAALNDDADFAGATIAHLDSLDDAVAAHTTSLGNIDTSLSTINGNVSGLITTTNGLTSDVGGLQSDVTTLQTDVGSVTSDLSAHSSATTSVHGISNTADLATKTYADSAVSTHSSDTTSVHGISDTGALATKTYADDAVSTHSSDTTSVHGIADTSKLVTTDGGQTIDGTTTVENLEISGSLTFSGTATEINQTDLTISDPLIYLADGNTGNLNDLGFVANYNDGTYKHTGLARDASDSKWKLFDGVTDEPTSTVNFSQGSLDALAVGAFEATSATINGVSFTAKADKTSTINDMNGSHTVVSGDVNNIREMSGGGTLSIPTDNSFWPVGQRMEVIQTGGSQVTIAGSSGVTVNGTPGLKLRAQWSAATIIKRATDTFVVIGDLSA